MKFIVCKLFIALAILAISVATYEIKNQSKNLLTKKNPKIIDDKFLSNYHKLKESMIQQGSKFGNYGLKFITKSNRYIVANQDMKNNTEIINIPFKNLIHIENPYVKNFCKSLNLKIFKTNKSLFENQYKCLKFWLLNQIRNPIEKFESYIETIPKSFEEYYEFFPKKDSRKLKNTLHFKNNHELLMKDIKLLNESKLKNKFSRKEIMTAEIALRSRNFGVKVGKKEYNVLAPFTDMFNFDPNVNTEWLDKLKDVNDSFILKSIKPIKRGNEINLNYGEKDNSSLFYAYGFTLKDNPFMSSIDDFVLKYKKIEFKDITLNEKDSSLLVKIINKLKNFDSKKGLNFSNQNMRKYEINLFEFILKELRSYKNTEIIEKIKKNINESKNNLNILRTLIAEDKLIEANTNFINEFISILKGKKEDMNTSDSIVVKQNHKYFTHLFHKFDDIKRNK
jgi:hypothetical protein